MPVIPLTDDFMLEILHDISLAEHKGLPGPAKHDWVVAACVSRHCDSPPPTWIYLLMQTLNVVIPVLVKWLERKYGQRWLSHLDQSLIHDKAPWQNSDQPKTPNTS